MLAGEGERLAALYDLKILHTEKSSAFDAITELASKHFNAPICAITLIDKDEQWFKSQVGLDCSSTPRSIAFCHYTIQSDGMLIVADATLDSRFCSNPLVVGDPNLRFYAGCSISCSPNIPLGALCILDVKPRGFTETDREALKKFAKLVEQQLHLHKMKNQLQEQLQCQRELSTSLASHAVQLERQSKLFDLASSQAQMMVFDYDLANGDCVLNAEACNVLEIEQADGTSLQRLVNAVQFPDWYIKLIRNFDQERLDYEVEVEIVTGKGNRKWLAEQGRMTMEAGQAPRRVGIAMDITQAKLRENSLKLLFQNNPLPMWVYEYATRKFLAVNEAALAQYGHTREKFLKMDLFDIRPVSEHARLQQRLATEMYPKQLGEEWVHQRADGSCFTVSIHSTEIIYQGKACVLTAAIDVTEQRRHEETISFLAHHDALTELPNRRLFLTRLESCLSATNRQLSQTGLMLLDLDNFKVINDTYGHDVGDRLIVGVANRLRQIIGPDGTLARLGGDEFAVILVGLSSPEAIQSIATQLLECLKQPVICDGHSITIGLSIGITVAPQDGMDASALLRNADLALYGAKASGRNTFRSFEPQMYLRLVERRELEQDLRQALDGKQFELHYQPIVDLKTGAPVAYETLLRWNHPRRGRVPPADFIPVAEEIGLIEPISDWVMQTACLGASRWPRPYKVAINVSPVQFSSGSIVSSVRRALQFSGLPPERLEIEVTESLILENSDKNIEILNELDALGVSLSLDDFGTGYSSLSRLLELPVKKLKIDRSFVSGLGVTSRGLKIIQAAISLGRSLKITTVAEGIETQAQATILRRLGCHQGQGYYFGKPAPNLMTEAEVPCAITGI